VKGGGSEEIERERRRRATTGRNIRQKMSGDNRVYDPSKLHLKRELTQIRKASRVLRDPGTSSSWKSPLSSTRSVFNSITPKQHHNDLHHHHFCRNGNDPLNAPRNDGNDNENNGRERDKEKEKEKEKERRVFLYNWRSNKSSSEKSLAVVVVMMMMTITRPSLPGSAASASASVDGSLSDPRNAGEDSESDTCIADHRRRGHHQPRHYSTALRCRDTRLAFMASPTMVRRAVGKKKSRRASASVILRQQLQKQKQKKSQRVAIDRNSLNTKWAPNGVPSSSLALSQDDSVSLVDQSDYSDEYCASEDLRRRSAESPLLSKLMHKNRLV